MATATPRTAGVVDCQSNGVYKETFTPNVEERDENEAQILRLQLPEFKKQQITVRVERKRTVKVIGERQAGDNRWFRLDETYPIPEVCVINKITAQLKNGVLSITMPKQTTGPATAPAVEAVSAPPPSKQTEPEQSTLENGREEISPETKAEIKEPEAAAPTEGTSNPAKVAEENKGISAELQKQGSEKAKEEAPTPAAAVAENDSVKGDSGEAETTMDQKTSRPEKKEIENQNLEKGKDCKTEEVGKIKNEDTGKIDTGTPHPIATLVGRMPVPATVSLAVAAYFAYAYYTSSFDKQCI